MPATVNVAKKTGEKVNVILSDRKCNVQMNLLMTIIIHILLNSLREK